MYTASGPSVYIAVQDENVFQTRAEESTSKLLFPLETKIDFLTRVRGTCSLGSFAFIKVINLIYNYQCFYSYFVMDFIKHWCWNWWERW